MKPSKPFMRALLMASLLIVPFVSKADTGTTKTPAIPNSKAGMQSVAFVNETNVLGKKLFAVSSANGPIVTVYQNSLSQTIESDGSITDVETTLAFKFNDGKIAFLRSAKLKTGEVEVSELEHLHTNSLNTPGGGYSMFVLRSGDSGDDEIGNLRYDPDRPKDDYGIDSGNVYFEVFDLAGDGSSIEITITPEMQIDEDLFVSAVTAQMAMELVASEPDSEPVELKDRDKCIANTAGLAINIAMKNWVFATIKAIKIGKYCFGWYNLPGWVDWL